MTTYTNIPKPTTPTYTNVNSSGKEGFDDVGVLFDDPNVFFDGFDNSFYTNVSKPSGTSYTNISKPT